MEAKDTIFQCKNKLLFTFNKFREEEGDIDILGLKMSLQRVMNLKMRRTMMMTWMMMMILIMMIIIMMLI